MQAYCGVALPATVVIDCPTRAALADHIFGLQSPQASQSVPPMAQPRLQLTQGTALALQAGPLISRGPLEPTGGLTGGMISGDAVSSVPLSRWDVECVGGSSGSAISPRFGAYLRQPERFAAAAFSLSAVEAALLDPQQRLLLECVAEAAARENGSGSPGLDLLQPSLGAGLQVGVYVGIASSDYGSLVQKYTAAGAFHATSCAPSVACGRLSFTFGFTGPSISVGALLDPCSTMQPHPLLHGFPVSYFHSQPRIPVSTFNYLRQIHVIHPMPGLHRRP